MGMLFFYVFNSFTLFFLSPECGIAQLSLSLFVSSSWSNLMTSIIFLFDLVHLYDLFCDELVDDIVEEIDVKEVLKSSIFVIQKATAPNFG